MTDITERPQTSTVTWQDQGITHALHRFTVSTVADPEEPEPYQAYGSDHRWIPQTELATHLGLSVRGADPQTRRWVQQRLRFELNIDCMTQLALPGRLLGAQGAPGRLSSSPPLVLRATPIEVAGEVSGEAQVWYAWRRPIPLVRQQSWALQLHYSGAPVGVVVSAYLATVPAWPRPDAGRSVPNGKRRHPIAIAQDDAVQWYTVTRSPTGAGQTRLELYPLSLSEHHAGSCSLSRLGARAQTQDHGRRGRGWRGLVDHLGVALETASPELTQALRDQAELVLQREGQKDCRWSLSAWELTEGALGFLHLSEPLDLPRFRAWSLSVQVPNGLDGLPDGDFTLTVCLLGWGEWEVI